MRRTGRHFPAVAVAVALAGAGCTPTPLGSGAPKVVDCSTCHGSALNAAPPRGIDGETDPSSAAVGAHQAHLTDGTLRKAIACSDCHPVPATVDAPGHSDGKATFAFSALASAGGQLSPRYLAATASCSATWCHGALLSGGSNTQPVWTDAASGSQAACGTCHGLPPPAPHAQDPGCRRCHAGTVNEDGTVDVAGGRHIDGEVQATAYHPEGFADPGRHGAEAMAGVASCATCHGPDLTGGSAGVSCNTCHGGWKTSCSFCHGGTDSQTGAPPADLAGRTAASEVTVGAHTAHLTDSPIRKAVSCSECHLVPSDAASPGHLDPDGIAELAFGPLASAGGAAPVWDRASATCSSSYCHGATTSGGTVTAPKWTQVDGSQAACGACHGLPPPPPHAADTDCSACHPGTVEADGSIDVEGGLHLDGRVQTASSHPAGWLGVHGEQANLNLSACTVCHGEQLTGGTSGVSCDRCHGGFKTSCTFCHGGADNQTGAPPADVAGRTATTEVTVGAHTAHLVDGTVRKAVACSECHQVPASALSPGHVDQGTATLTFGPLARRAGANPVWNRAEQRCSSSYCHGATLGGGSNTAPQWTRVDGSQDACGTCHGLPPPAPHPPGQSACNGCHPATVRADGTLDLAGGKHIDGIIQAAGWHPAGYADGAVHGAAANAGLASCQQCHGSDLGGGSSGKSCNTCHPGFRTACTFCHGGADNQTGAPPASVAGLTATTALGVGAHTAHLAALSGISSPVACSECHTVPADALSPGHIDAATATVTFGALARAAGADPSWNRASGQCSSTYCHGATLSGGSNKTPRWTAVDGTQDACGTCHGLPPTGGFGGYPAGTFEHHDGPHQTFPCGRCHPGFSSTGNGITDPAQHVDGTVQLNAIATGCACH